MIYAFEPFPDNFKKLQANISLNKLNGERVKLYNFAISDRSGKASFSINADAEMGGSLVCKTGKAIEVETTTADDFIEKNRIARVDILKVDIEGAEYGVFRSMKDETLSRIVNIIAEVHPVDGETVSDLVKLLSGKGLSLIKTDKSGQIYYFARATEGVNV
jgi:FkbM family methyltransferase